MKSTKKRPVRRSNPDALVATMEKWPESWAGLDEDKDPGQRLLAELRPFIRHLVEKGLSAKTVRRHLDNLWAIGGEVVREFNDEPSLRRRPARQLLFDAIDATNADVAHAYQGAGVARGLCAAAQLLPAVVRWHLGLQK